MSATKIKPHPKVRLFAIGAVVIFSAALLVGAAFNGPGDADAYWQAALRLRDGLPLYPPLPDLDAGWAYRYAPWFAQAWMPLTYLPRELVFALWRIILLGASVAAILPLWREGSLASRLTGIYLGAFLAWQASGGNVDPLIIAALVYALPGRWGPVAIGVAASLKAVPILYAVRYVAVRDWRRLALTIAVTTLLVAPMALYDLSAYPFDGGGHNPLLTYAPWAYLLLVAGLTWWALRSRSWALAGLLTVLAWPRLSGYTLPWLLPGLSADELSEERPTAYAIARRPSVAR
jgi:hypothetical protein